MAGSGTKSWARCPHQLLQTVFPIALAEIEAALARSDRWEGELVHTTRDGTKVVVYSRWSLQRDDRGRPIGTFESDTDITERKRTDEALRRSQAAYLAEAQRLSRTGSFGWDVTSGRIFWSDETFRIFELDPASVPSLEVVVERTHPDDRALVQETLERAQASKQDMDVEHRLLMPDGRVKHLHVVGRADTSSGLQFIGALSDITVRKEAFAALELTEQRYRDVFDHMPIGLVQIDVSNISTLFQELRDQGVSDLGAYLDRNPEFIRRTTDAAMVEAANQHALRMFGAKSMEEMMGPSTRIWGAGFDTIRRNQESRFRGEEFFQEETRMTTLDGRVINVLITVARPVATPGKSLIGIIDITDRIRAQEMLSRVQADFAHAARLSMLGELTASIAHEVNQPLAAISANGQAGLRWLGRPDVDMGELREITESIVADAQRAARIISRIRAMAARQAPEQVQLSLDDVIREALVFLRPENPVAGRDDRPRARAVAADGAGRPHPAAAGDRQPGRQRHAGDGADGTGPAADRHRHVRARRRDGAVHRRGQRPRHCERSSGPAVRELLHDQGGRHGHGPADLPLDHRSPWRADRRRRRGPRWRRPRRLHAAGGGARDDEALAERGAPRRCSRVRRSPADSTTISPSASGDQWPAVTGTLASREISCRSAAAWPSGSPSTWMARPGESGAFSGACRPPVRRRWRSHRPGGATMPSAWVR